MNGRHVLLLTCCLLALAGWRHAVAQESDPFERGNCEGQFIELRDEVERRGKALQKAGEGNVSAPEMCRLLRNYTAVEARLVKFLRDQQEVCGIPPQVVQQAGDGHSKALAMRNQVCQVAAGPPAPPPTPPSQGLSGALGTPSFGGPPADARGGGGVFDTLTGNVLQR